VPVAPGDSLISKMNFPVLDSLTGFNTWQNKELQRNDLR
jgi:hypothetical protein